MIAIIGATGLVGEKMTEIAVANKRDVMLFASNNSSGKQVKGLPVHSVDELDNYHFTHALLATEADVSKQIAEKLTRKNTVCIDNSSCFRMDKNVPLVVPCVNGYTARGKLIANPNCTTIQIVTALCPLKVLGIERITAVTYQAVSGAGKRGLDDLSNGTTTAFCHTIRDNLIPAIGKFDSDGYTEEENKVMSETKKILEMPSLAVNAFCVRVPVTVCHGVFLNVKVKKKFDLKMVKELFASQQNLVVTDDVNSNLYPMPQQMKGKTYVSVGRITADKTENAINCFVVADNLLVGASYNAWKILELTE